MVNKLPPETDAGAILSRLDRSTPDALLKSLAEEFVRLYQAHRSLLARMHALEVTETFYDQIAADQERIAMKLLPRSVTVEAAFSLAAESGFYHLEYDERGTPYRWTGPEPTFTLDVMVDRTRPTQLRMRYLHIHSRHADHTVQCYVDGEPLDVTMVQNDGEFEVHGELPTRDTAGGTVVTFICPSVSSPGIFDESQDIRQLGLAFRWLRIDPLENDSWSQDAEGETSLEVGKEMRPQRPAPRSRRRASPVAGRR